MDMWRRRGRTPHEIRPREVGYPESWLKKVTDERPEQFKLKENINETPESQLVD